MYKFLGLLLLPFVLYAQSGKLVYIVDGDTVVLSDGGSKIVCHMGEIDTPERVVNSKLKREMSKCSFPQEKFIEAGESAYTYAKSLLKVGETYNYEVLGYTRKKNPICKFILPKGLHVEIRPAFDEIMVEKGYALPYVVHASKERKKLLLRVAKDAKIQKLGLWKENLELMNCLVSHRYSLRSLK